MDGSGPCAPAGVCNLTELYTPHPCMQTVCTFVAVRAIDVRNWDGLKVRRRTFSRMENERSEGQCRPCDAGAVERILVLDHAAVSVIYVYMLACEQVRSPSHERCDCTILPGCSRY